MSAGAGGPPQLGKDGGVGGDVEGPSRLGGAPKKALAMISPALKDCNAAMSKTTECAGVGVPHWHLVPNIG